MNILIKLLFLTATLWSTTYSLSYALYNLKNRKFKAAFASALLSLSALALTIITLFFRTG